MKSWFRIFSAMSLAVTLSSVALADVKLPNIIGSNMVLQRDIVLPIWGWADAGEEVTVTLGSASVKATADADGKWSVKLPAQKAGGPHTVTVHGKNKLELTNVLIGEVWVGSGQSNMEWSVAASANPQEEIANAKYPQIRFFNVAPKKTVAIAPMSNVNPEVVWQECTPQSAPNMSAVCYYFGRHLQKELDGVPIGLINTSWGGTRIEPWTTPEGFASVNDDSVKAIGTNAVAQRKAYEEAAAKAKAEGKPAPNPGVGSGTPVALFNANVAPIVPFAIKGALWYQGESNRGEGMLYEKKMQALINGWRGTWGQGDFPFYFVQLAPYTYVRDPKGPNGKVNPLPDDLKLKEQQKLAEIWQAQASVLKSVKNTGMCVTTDITNLADIHPKNKQDVGKRLALWALAKDYGKKDIVYSGPLFKDLKFEGGKAVVEFEHVGSGLVARDGKPLNWFTIAGDDGVFSEAKAEIVGNTVVLSSDKVATPVSVRFGWHELAEPNLMNKEGLPASPFRAGK
jgi:sialate O-acetylesterase